MEIKKLIITIGWVGVRQGEHSEGIEMDHKSGGGMFNAIIKAFVSRLKGAGCLISIFALLQFGLVANILASDYFPGKEWRTATPESQGMSSEALTKMLDYIWQKNYTIDSITIVRNGYVVLDAYNRSNKPQHKHILYSCSKSVISALIGIAIDKGYIKSVDQPILSFFPERTAENLDQRKKNLTLKHVLMMATGLRCQDSYLYGWVGLYEMRNKSDWVKHMINLPMIASPGSTFEYCNGATFLLSAVLQKTTGRNALEFANEHLFAPLAIENAEWKKNQQSISFGYNGLSLRPRDMAKFGYLFLKRGKWMEKQVVSTHWVNESTRKHMEATMTPGYGYQWWVVSPDIYTAIGYKGQRIYVLKKQNMVAVITANVGEQRAMIPEGLLWGYIMPSIKSVTALPENRKAFQALQSATRFWQDFNVYARLVERVKSLGPAGKPEMKTYVNEEYGFSARYHADLFVVDPMPATPIIHSRSSVDGLRSFMVVIAEIPSAIKLADSANFFVYGIKNQLKIETVNIQHKELIKLSDGTDANYFELDWHYQRTGLVTSGVAVNRNGKLISILSTGKKYGSIEDLKQMSTSLVFK
jgi:CubicO group peptidase (beta-lactamase class C family)